VNHDWQTQTYVVTLLDGSEVWAATLVCECGYQTATDIEHASEAEAVTAVERAAAWATTHFGVV